LPSSATVSNSAAKVVGGGNRALLIPDPDGNLVDLFTPVTDEARAKFGV
jgi:hypothetical protein